ncbi:hypothetical protein C8F01DRAFT_1271539 [Mycena amicta]|nr:hypothetical protein C8F01DRAFT_1271539 [Mycena amicta]
MRMRSRDQDLSDALACYEIAKAMTRACRALSTDLSDPSHHPTARLDLLDLMAESLCSMCQSAPEEICDALDAGLVKFFFSCAANEAMPRRTQKLQTFLQEAIPQLMVLHSVLCSLEDALDEVKHLDAAAHFKFDDELRLLKDWNALCWKICSKTSMKRCGGCCIRHYCSRTCQKTDYHARHRNACPILREYYERSEIAHKLLTFMRAYPDDVPCTSFDYRTGGRCVISVAKLDEEYYNKLDEEYYNKLSGDDDFTAECGFDQGHGRMQFHVMRMFQEDLVRSYRLRLSSGSFLCGLRRRDVARRKPPLGVGLTGYSLSRRCPARDLSPYYYY